MEEIKKEKSEFIKTKIKEIREKIAKSCTEFATKKFDYDDENKISWIGRVFLCKENEVEERPKDNKERNSLAYFTLKFPEDKFSWYVWINIEKDGNLFIKGTGNTEVGKHVRELHFIRQK